MGLFPLQLGHTLIYLGAWGCLIGLWVYGFTRRWREGLPVFFGAPALISLGLLFNQGECVFQSWPSSSPALRRAGRATCYSFPNR